MLKADCSRYILRFREPAVTSRAVMTEKETYIINVYDPEDDSRYGVGEVPIFRGLSAEDTPEFESVLNDYVRNFDPDSIPEISSIRFGVESALMDMDMRRNPVHEPFSYTVNGLVWMGDKQTMASRIRSKLDAGFRCVKLKIGGIDFDEEVDLLRYIRDRFSPESLELRLDANGSLTGTDVFARLDILSKFAIHSIEQPVRQRQPELMRKVIASSPIPVALDEELIGFTQDNVKEELLAFLRPAYIILKPSLCGGFAEAEKWISTAEHLGIGWWATSALESNIGLTAIALWLNKFNVNIPQGLGTGSLYLNNFPSNLSMAGDKLVYQP